MEPGNLRTGVRHKLCIVGFWRLYMIPMMPLRFLTFFLSVRLVVPQAPLLSQAPVKIDVDLVLINAVVTDNEGRPVTGLDKTGFQVWEDNVQQEIQYFSAEEVPVSLGIVFDISGSMNDNLSVARDAVIKFLKTGTP